MHSHLRSHLRAHLRAHLRSHLRSHRGHTCVHTCSHTCVHTFVHTFAVPPAHSLWAVTLHNSHSTINTAPFTLHHSRCTVHTAHVHTAHSHLLQKFVRSLRRCGARAQQRDLVNEGLERGIYTPARFPLYQHLHHTSTTPLTPLASPPHPHYFSHPRSHIAVCDPGAVLIWKCALISKRRIHTGVFTPAHSHRRIQTGTFTIPNDSSGGHRRP